MELSPIALVGIALATMFFGYFFGLFEGRGQGYKRRQKEEEALQPPVVPMREPGPADRNNLMELRRDNQGQPALVLEGRQVDASSVSGEQRRRLIELMVLLRPWIDPAAARVAAPLKVPTPAPSAEGAFARTAVGVTGDAVKPSAAGPSTTSAPEPPVIPPATLSLVAQIDAVLQRRLVGSPLAGRGIKLTEAAHGGAIVFVGTSQYDGVDKVPDPAIQAAIRAAIEEWEKSFTPR